MKRVITSKKRDDAPLSLSDRVPEPHSSTVEPDLRISVRERKPCSEAQLRFGGL